MYLYGIFVCNLYLAFFHYYYYLYKHCCCQLICRMVTYLLHVCIVVVWVFFLKIDALVATPMYFKYKCNLATKINNFSLGYCVDATKIR